VKLHPIVTSYRLSLSLSLSLSRPLSLMIRIANRHNHDAKCYKGNYRIIKKEIKREHGETQSAMTLRGRVRTQLSTDIAARV